MVVGLLVLVNVSGLADTLVYLALSTGRDTPEVVQFLHRYLCTVAAVLSVVNVAWAARTGGALARLKAALARGTPPRQLAPADVVAALTLHRRVYWVLLAQWVIPSLGYPLARHLAGYDETPGLVHVVVSGLTTGMLVSAVGYYTFYLVQRTRIAPVLLRDGSIAHLDPVRLTRAWHHIGQLVLVLGAVMPLSLLALVMSGQATTAGLWFVAAAFLAVGLFQAGGVLAAISRPAGHLAGRMAAVGEGHLDVHARIDALDTFGALASHFNAMVEGLRQRDMIRETFGRYVTRQIADEILAGRVQLGGERRTATVLFSDIRGFTRMSEDLSPEEVVAFLNRYLSEMVDSVITHGGVLDKFIGDAVMAVFGVPVGNGGVDEDARAAVRCALDMCRRLDTLNDERRADGRPPIEIGIGVHTGELVAGNIGSPQRMQYTVIGDTVNVCSRIEGLTRGLQRRILVSEVTAALLDGSFLLERLDAMPVRGRNKPVGVFAARAA
jgi:class 3 adenylate cyclase